MNPTTQMDELGVRMARFESTLTEELGPAPGVLRRVARSALDAGGKRMRPRIVYLSFMAAGGGGDIETACRRYAVAVEYLHTATLLHDDLVDGASLRRGEPAAHRRFGPKEAVLSGDLLLARCLSLVAGGGNLLAMETLARAAERMAVGEAMEAELARDDGLEVDGWYAYAAAKTGALFSAAAELGGHAAGAPPQMRAALAGYGEEMGLAFQVADDLLDLTGDAAAMGKDAGADLRAGIPSLPVIEALSRLDAGGSRVVRNVLVGRANGDLEAMLHRAVALVREHGAPAAAGRALDHVRRATEELVALPDTAPRRALEALALAAVERLS